MEDHPFALNGQKERCAEQSSSSFSKGYQEKEEGRKRQRRVSPFTNFSGAVSGADANYANVQFVNLWPQQKGGGRRG